MPRNNMPRIENVGIAYWSGRNVFTLAEQVAELEREREQAFDDLYDEAQHHRREPKSSMLLERYHVADEELENPRLNLQLKLKFDQEMRPQDVPARYRGCFPDQPGQDNYYVWESSTETSLLDHPLGRPHPLFLIISGLAAMTGHEVEAWLCTHDMKMVVLKFHFGEDIENPTRFLLALCNKMVRWSTPR